jgi:hypothetical protein
VIFNHHTSFEVSKSLTDAKFIANDAAETYRYKYRAKATLLGDVNVEPYNAIYLAGLSGDMNGYWTVLSVTHLFGDKKIPYALEVELGSDQLGQDDPAGQGFRDVEGELNGASATTADVDTQLVDLQFVEQLSTDGDLAGEVTPTSNSELPTLRGKTRPPNFSIMSSASYWATRGGRQPERKSAAEYEADGYSDTSDPGVDPASLEQGATSVVQPSSLESSEGSGLSIPAGDLSGYAYVYVSGWVYVPDSHPDVLITFGTATSPTFLIEVKNSWAFFYQKLDPSLWPQEGGVNSVHLQPTEESTGTFRVRDVRVTAATTASDSIIGPGGNVVAPGSVVSTDGSNYLVYLGTSQPAIAREGDVWIDFTV